MMSHPKRMGAIFEIDPKIGSVPASANVSNRGVLQELNAQGTISCCAPQLDMPLVNIKPHATELSTA